MEVTFCLDCLEEALHGQGKPEIFNTDQGVQLRFKESPQHRFVEPRIVARRAPQQASSNPSILRGLLFNMKGTELSV